MTEIMNIIQINDKVDVSLTKLLFGLKLRKWVHIRLFGVLGITVFGWSLSFSKANIICLVYVILDELHQFFVPERNAKVTDILIDTAVFLLEIVLFSTFRRMQKVFEKN